MALVLRTFVGISPYRVDAESTRVATRTCLYTNGCHKQTKFTTRTVWKDHHECNYGHRYRHSGQFRGEAHALVNTRIQEGREGRDMQYQPNMISKEQKLL